MDTQIYEIGYLLPPTIPEEGLGEKVTEIKNLVESKKGTFIAEGFPQMKKLAYEIKKFDQGYFGFVKFELPIEAATELAKDLEVNKSILRYLLIKTVKDSEKAVGASTSVRRITKQKKEEVSEEDAKQIDKEIEELVIE